MTLANPDVNKGLSLAAGLKSEHPRDAEIRPLAEMERFYIEMVISVCDGNIPRASNLLQVSPSTIYRKRAAWAKLGY